jgi:hypothetical protein
MKEDWDKIAALLKEIEEYESPIWSVYVLANAKRKELYFGVTKKSVPERGADHARGETEALKHWDFDADGVQGALIAKGLVQPKASDLAHRLERKRFPSLPDYRTIRTSGI